MVVLLLVVLLLEVILLVEVILQLLLLQLLLLLQPAAASREIPMDIVNPVLENNPGMSLFLEEVAKITNPIMRYKVITNGFEDLDELAKMDPGHAKRACDVIRKSTGSVLTKDISIGSGESFEDTCSVLHLHLCGEQRVGL